MTISYATSSLSDGAAVNVAHTCSKILSGLATSCDQRVEQLETLSERDRSQIRYWNQSIPERFDACVHKVIEQQTLLQPDSPAVCAWDGSLTYQKLDKLSSKLAHYLCRLGVGPETLVPLCFEKSMWAIVAFIAVLKSGGACVPLNPSHPKVWLDLMIKETNAKILLTSTSHAHLLEGSIEKAVPVCPSLLNDLEEVEGYPDVGVSPENAAFVLFTSGSTGHPKGIIHEHAAFSTMCRTYGEALHLDSSSRVLQFAAYNFDVSTVDIANTLMNGGCLCVPSEYHRKNDIVGVINDMQVNWADLTPSFVGTFNPEDIPTLRTLVLAGELVKQEHVQCWANKVRLINCYGPAECGGCTVNIYPGPYSQPETIGRAMSSWTCWVADARYPNRLASIGAVGELVVEGPTLARGYLNNREKTKAAFTKNPGWVQAAEPASGDRFYRTGDLVYYRSDGLLNFVGRKDTQIKIRGQRVELCEAEHCLSTYPAISKCLVLFPETGHCAQRLVAVVQLRGFSSQPAMSDCLRLMSGIRLQQSGFNPDDASAHMKKHLPAYMVPTAWVVIEDMPLTTSIKIDRKRVEAWLAGSPPNHQFQSSLDQLRMDVLSPLSDDIATALDINAMVADIIANGNQQLRDVLLGHNFSLSVAGLDSIQAMTLSRRISQKYATDIGIEKLTSANTTVQSVAEEVELSKHRLTGRHATPSVDILREVGLLHSELLLSACESSQGVHPDAQSVETVVLTGVTGFLGTQILRQLMIQPGIKKVIVHVRASSITHGLQRVIDSANAAGWWSDSYEPKLEIWLGDLSEPRIGLGPKQWRRLTGDVPPQDRVHAIIHNGAVVRWNAAYSTLKQANVISTLELLGALSKSASCTRFTYISGGQRLVPGEEDEETIISGVASSTGYAQTKLVSELLVKRHASSGRASGRHISVVKPSYIIGTAEEGLANTSDYIWRLAAGAIDLGAYSRDDADSWFFISDVQRVASAIVQSISTHDTSAGFCNVIKILDGLPLRDFWSILADDFGYDLQPWSGDVWWRRLRAGVEAKGKDHPLWPLLYMLDSRSGNLGAPLGNRVPELSTAARVRIRAAVMKNIEYLGAIGFFPKPNRHT